MSVKLIEMTPHAVRHDTDTVATQRRVTDAMVIVAKYPQPGKVKTRLGATIGHERAAALYTAFLRDLSERFTAGERAGGYHLRWACVNDTPGGDDPRRLWALLDASSDDSGASVARHPYVFAQQGDSLAERLYNICVEMRAAGYRQLVIVSSDSPHAPLATVRRAFALLTTHDVAIGPALDGGYYLIGLHLDAPTGAEASFPDLFRGVGMSEPTTLQQTLARASLLGLTVAALPTTFDIDEATDLTRLANHLRAHGAHLAPHTAAALAALTPATMAAGSG